MLSEFHQAIKQRSGLLGTSALAFTVERGETDFLSPPYDPPLQHIVKLRDNVDMDAHIATLNNTRGNGHIVHHKWD